MISRSDADPSGRPQRKEAVLSLLIATRERARVAVPRRDVTAEQKFEMPSGWRSPLPQQSLHSPAFARSKLTICRGRVIASRSFPLMPDEFDKFRDRSRIAA